MSQHPVLDDDQVRQFISTLAARPCTDDTVQGFLRSIGVATLGPSGKAIDELVDQMVTACATDTDRALEPVEAKYSGPVFSALDALPDRALGDHRFWSYLAVAHFWKFISRRQRAAWEAASGEPANPDAPESERQKLERYLIGKDHYHLPLRMYLRGQAIAKDDDFALADINGGGTDFWRSQVLGVRTAHYPPLARAVAKAQHREQLDIEHQRPAGRRVNRLRVNIEFFLHDEQQASECVDPVWRTLPEDEVALTTKKTAKARTKAATKKSSSS